MKKMVIILLAAIFLVFPTGCSRPGPSSPPQRIESHQRPTVVVVSGPPVSFKLAGDGGLGRIMVGEVKRDEMTMEAGPFGNFWGLMPDEFGAPTAVSELREITYPAVPPQYHQMEIFKNVPASLSEGKYYFVDVETTGRSRLLSGFQDGVRVDFQIVKGKVLTFRSVCMFKRDGKPVLEPCGSCPDDKEVEGQLMQYACGATGD